MVSKTLIAAVRKAQDKHETTAKAKRDTEIADFKRKFSAIYGRSGKRAVNPSDSNPADTTTPTDDPTIWEDDDTPQRLPDVPTVSDDAPNAQIRPATPSQGETLPTTPPTGADAPQGGKSRPGAKRRDKGGRKPRKGTRK